MSRASGWAPWFLEAVRKAAAPFVFAIGLFFSRLSPLIESYTTHMGKALRFCGCRLFWGGKQRTDRYVWCPSSYLCGCRRSSLGKALASPGYFSSSWSFATFWQGVCLFAGKHIGAAGQESLKPIALDYWSRNSHFLLHNYICFAPGLHNSLFKSFGARQGSVLSKLSNHCSILSPFPYFPGGTRPLCSAPAGSTRAPCGSCRGPGAGRIQQQHCGGCRCCGQLLPSSGLSRARFWSTRTGAEAANALEVIEVTLYMHVCTYSRYRYMAACIGEASGGTNKLSLFQ